MEIKSEKVVILSTPLYLGIVYVVYVSNGNDSAIKAAKCNLYTI